jgi:hypothetical protein
MPLKNKKACQAKAQRVQGEKFFKKGFIDDLENHNDPDWVDEEGSDSDSEFEGSGGWAVSISKAALPDLKDVLDSEGEGEEVAERKNGEGGMKRKAAIDDKVCAGSDDGEEGAEESEAHQILSEAEEFWKKQFSKVLQLKLKFNYFDANHSVAY